MLVYLLWLTAWSLAASLFEVYFFNLGLSFPSIYFADSLWFFGSLLVIPLFKGFRSRSFMLAGIAIAFFAVSVLYLEPSPSAAYLFRMIIGMTNFFFWAPFNTLFYEYRKDDHAVMGAIYYAMSPLLSLFIPAGRRSVERRAGVLQPVPGCSVQWTARHHLGRRTGGNQKIARAG